MKLLAVGIIIRLKPEIPNSGGESKAHELQTIGFSNVLAVREAKYIEVTVRADTPRTTIEEMCQKLLTNPEIEVYEILWEERQEVS